MVEVGSGQNATSIPMAWLFSQNQIQTCSFTTSVIFLFGQMSESNACLSKPDMQASLPGALWLIHPKVDPHEATERHGELHLILLCSFNVSHYAQLLLQ